MALRLTWTSRGGLRLTETARTGQRARAWISVPLTPKTRTGRRRRVSRGVSIRL